MSSLKDALWSVINLIDAIGTPAGPPSAPPDAPTEGLLPPDGAALLVSAESVVRSLCPLLFVYQLPGSEHLGHMLALVIRWEEEGVASETNDVDAIQVLGRSLPFQQVHIPFLPHMKVPPCPPDGRR